VNYTTGESLNAFTLDTDTGYVLGSSTLFVNHSDVAESSWTSATNADNITVLANVTTHVGTQDIVAGGTLRINPDGIKLDIDGLGLIVNASDSSNHVVNWSLGTNRSSSFAGVFQVGDQIAWLGSGYEITAIDSQNVTLGSTTTVEVSVGAEFTVGSTTFTLDDVSTSAALISTGGNTYTVNTTYLTIGSEKLKLNENPFVGSTVKKATFRIGEEFVNEMIYHSRFGNMTQELREMCVKKLYPSKFYEFHMRSFDECGSNIENISCSNLVLENLDISSSTVTTCTKADKVELLDEAIAAQQNFTFPGSPALYINQNLVNNPTSVQDLASFFCDIDPFRNICSIDFSNCGNNICGFYENKTTCPLDY